MPDQPDKDDDIGAKINAALGPVTESLAALREENAHMRGVVEGIGKAPPAADSTKKAFSRAELSERVAAGELTQAQADDIWERGFEERLSEKIVTSVQTTTQEAQRLRDVQAEIDRYTKVSPDILKEGSDIRTAITKSFNDQVTKLGQDAKKVETELLAIRSVLGPIDQLEAVQDRKLPADTHEDVYAGSGGGDQDNGDQRQDGSPKGLSRAERRYYSDAITKGIYPDWDAVAEELKYADPRVRSKARTRAA